jgi:lysophospholipase L1-like esterase
MFPDRLVTHPFWKNALAMWSDCLHPSAAGYDHIASRMASTILPDVVNLLQMATGEQTSAVTRGAD